MMILVDTSVWVDHLRRRNGGLAGLLEAGEALCHPFIVGELACGDLRRRAEILELLDHLPGVPVVDHHEVIAFIDAHTLMGTGIGWVDAHLLASTVLSRAKLWTMDRPLARAATKLGVVAAVH
jgi:predicted nucleic acid-binding protein